MNSIQRDIFILRKALVQPIDYVRGTNTVPIILHIRDYDIPDGVSAAVYIKKPSGKKIYNSAEISGNTVTINPTRQMFAESGRQFGQVEITYGTKNLSSFVLEFRVEENLIDGGAIESTDECRILDALIEDAKKTLITANDAVSAANAAAKNAANKAEAADEAAQNAGIAAKNANVAIADAELATNAANTAASNADSEAALANSAAQRANAAAQACEDIASGAGYAQLRKDVDTIIALLNKAIITK